MKHTKKPEDLDAVFVALANKHRREIIYALGLMPHSVSRLASMRKLSLPAIHKHIRILQSARLIQVKKIGRINFLALHTETLLKLQDWLMQFRAYWGNNRETFENYSRYVTDGKSAKGGETE